MYNILQILVFVTALTLLYFLYKPFNRKKVEFAGRNESNKEKLFKLEFQHKGQGIVLDPGEQVKVHMQNPIELINEHLDKNPNEKKFTVTNVKLVFETEEGMVRTEYCTAKITLNQLNKIELT